MNTSFIVHTSFYEPVKVLSDNQLGRLFRMLFEHAMGEEVQAEGDIEMAFRFFKNQMGLDKQKYQEQE